MSNNRVNKTIKINNETLFQSALIIIVFFVYTVSINYPFMGSFDDNNYIVKNSHLSFSFSNIAYFFRHSYYYMYTPLTMLSYMLDYNIWGLNSFGYHLQNIFWHIIATISIYRCFRFFKIEAWISFFLCLIFAIHPQRIESVVWISERKDVLCAAFYFLSILFFLKYNTKNHKNNLVISFIFFMLAMLSKPMAISLPFILLIFLFYKKRTFKIKPFFILIPFFIFILFFFQITVTNQAVAYNRFNLIRQTYLIFYNIKFYFLNTVFPFDVIPVHPLVSIGSTIINTIAFYLLLLIISTIIIIRNKSFFLYNIAPPALCYILALAPIIGIIPFGYFEQADRWSYIPSVFIWLSAGLIIRKLLNSASIHKSEKATKTKIILRFPETITLISLISYCSILFTLTYQYQKKWNNLYTLFCYAAGKPNPNIKTLLVAGDMALRRSDAQQVLYISQKLEKTYPNNAVTLFYKTSYIYLTDRKKAIKPLLKLKFILKLNLNNKKEHSFYNKTLRMLIDTYSFRGEKEKALVYIDELIRNKKDTQFDLYSLYGLKSELNRNYKNAVHFYKKALIINPDNENIKNRIKECVKLTEKKSDLH